MSRITVQALHTQFVEQNERTERALDGIMGVLGTLVEVVTGGGTFNTPAEVVTSITEAPSMRGVSAQIEAFVKGEGKVTTPTKREMPAELAQGFAMVKATKDAMSPLNKALAVVCKGQPWVKATERSTDEIAAALALVKQEHGEKVMRAAFEALTTRVEAAAARK